MLLLFNGSRNVKQNDFLSTSQESEPKKKLFLPFPRTDAAKKQRRSLHPGLLDSQ